ncbi:proteinase B [Myxozyma melibiosi]|uniref:Proteinase B n=1 Tax=Myxozyma melibiosi TaxID=54550 RepID=A0ABR1FAQ4_9ASCO
MILPSYSLLLFCIGAFFSSIQVFAVADQSFPAALNTTTSLLSNVNDSSLSVSADFDTYPKVFTRMHSLRNRYVIVFADDADLKSIASHFSWLESQTSFSGHQFRQRVFKKFTGSLIKGYSGTFLRRFVFEIAKRPEIAYVENEVVFRPVEVQYNAPYNLARLAHRETLTNETSSVYGYDADPGLGVTVYTLDTGIIVEHEEFVGRATMVNLVRVSFDTDIVGHGTHVAGTAAGTTYGVAKNSSIVAVKVLNDRGSGSTSDILSGLEYVADQHTSNGGPSVINMSLGGSFSTALNQAVRNAVNQGIHVVVAAGNSGTDACSSSPASEPSVLTVGASDSNDNVASFSNIGSCVDVFAPGVNVLSAWNSDDDASRQLSGTSMASPLVAGLTAYLSAKDPSASVSDIQQQIKDLATTGMLKGIPTNPAGTPDSIAFNGYTFSSESSDDLS